MRDYKTLDFFWRWLPFSSRHADGHVVDDGGEAVHGHLPAAAGDRFPCRPVRREIFAQAGVQKLIGQLVGHTADELAISLGTTVSDHYHC